MVDRGTELLTTGGYPKCSVKSTVSEFAGDVMMEHRQSHGPMRRGRLKILN